MRAGKLLYGFWRYLLILTMFLFAMLDNLHWKEEYDGLFPYFARNFGGVAVKGRVDLLDLLFSIVPCVIVLYLFSHVIADDFKINCVYVFTRLGKKSTWLNRKTGELFLRILTVYLLLFFLSFLLGAGSGLRLSAPSLPLAGAYLSLLFCNVGTLFVFSYFQNVLSLRCGEARSFLYTMILYTGSLAGAFALYGKGETAAFFLPLFPASNQMYLWHKESTLFVGAAGQSSLHVFRLFHSVIVLGACFAAVYFVARRWLKKQDTVELMKEA